MEGRSELRIGRKDEEAQEQWPDLTRDPITPINAETENMPCLPKEKTDEFQAW